MNPNRRDREVIRALLKSARDNHVELTEEYVVDVLRKNPDFRVACYQEVSTCEREWFADLVAKDLGFGAWPKGDCSDADWETFKARLAAALPSRGGRYVTKEMEEADEVPAFLRHLKEED